MKNKKNLRLGVVVLIVIIIALVINGRYHKKPAPAAETEIPTAVSPEVTPAPVRSTKDTAATQNRNYDEALVLFGKKRVQFDGKCTASPVRSVFAQGEKIMIDNRGPQMRGFQIGGQNVVVPGYDYGIVTLSEKGNFGVDCGSQTNAATIIVQ